MTQEEANKRNQECIDNFRKYSVSLDTDLKIGLEMACIIVEGDAVLTHPWNNDTGHLQSSITHRVVNEVNGAEGQVGTNVEYGTFLEFGTQKMKPYPWLTPALNRNKSKINSIISKQMKRGVDDAGR